MITIRDAIKADIPLLTEMIRDSFRDLADRFQLTPDNCPKHPSNCQPEWIESALEKGVLYYILEDSETACGCVALEQATPEVSYIERLGVRPQFRRRGLGEILMSYVITKAKRLGAARVEIGIISDHTELKDWYTRLGFSVKNRARFEHLPFEVMFMFKELY